MGFLEALTNHDADGRVVLETEGDGRLKFVLLNAAGHFSKAQTSLPPSPSLLISLPPRSAPSPSLLPPPLPVPCLTCCQSPAFGRLTYIGPVGPRGPCCFSAGLQLEYLPLE